MFPAACGSAGSGLGLAGRRAPFLQPHHPGARGPLSEAKLPSSRAAAVEVIALEGGSIVVAALLFGSVGALACSARRHVVACHRSAVGASATASFASSAAGHRRRAVVCFSGATAAVQTPTLSQYDLQQLFSEAKQRSAEVAAGRGLGSEQWEEKAKQVRAASEDPDLWSDPARARQVMLDLQSIKAAEDYANRFSAAEEEMGTALELAAEEGDEAQVFLHEAQSVYDSWAEEIAQMEVEVLMSGKYDSLSCTLSIFAGAGGEEACDWVCMLERMYTGYCASKGWRATRANFTPGDSIGMKSVELEISGDYSYGMLQGEQGTHRLVRVWNGKRQTTFAGVEVMPALSDDVADAIDVKDSDLEFQFFRAGGKGGQNVNKVSTACRVKHLPTGIAQECREERHQSLNKSLALRRLITKLVAIQTQQRADEIEAIRGDLVEATWGAQVRNYVLQPYTMVKDTRSGHERGDADRVLEGDLGSHIDAYLRNKAEMG